MNISAGMDCSSSSQRDVGGHVAAPPPLPFFDGRVRGEGFDAGRYAVGYADADDVADAGGDVCVRALPVDVHGSPSPDHQNTPAPLTDEGEGISSFGRREERRRTYATVSGDTHFTTEAYAYADV